MAWFMMIYPSYIIANLIADGGRRAVAAACGPHRRPVVLTAMVDDGLGFGGRSDVVRAGVQSVDLGAGRTVPRGADAELHRLAVDDLHGHGAYRSTNGDQRRARWATFPPIVLLPLIVYGSLAISNTILGDVAPMPVIAAFVIGLPLAAAGMRLFSQPATG